MSVVVLIVCVSCCCSEGVVSGVTGAILTEASTRAWLPVVLLLANGKDHLTVSVKCECE